MAHSGILGSAVENANQLQEQRKFGRFESAFTSLISQKAEVVRCKTVGQHYRVVTLRGDDLRHRSWRPGDFFQILFAGWQARAYTPFVWSREGTVSFLAYVHGDGIASKWLETLQSGEPCLVYGPRRTLDLTELPRPLLLFGDETSLGTAGAALCSQTRGLECVFEVEDVDGARAALEAMGYREPVTFVNRGDLEVVRARLAQGMHGVFTGNAASIKQLYAALRKDGVSARRIKNVPYWAPGKRGLD